jgi:hypothetical protein
MPANDLSSILSKRFLLALAVMVAAGVYVILFPMEPSRSERDGNGVYSPSIAFLLLGFGSLSALLLAGLWEIAESPSLGRAKKWAAGVFIVALLVALVGFGIQDTVVSDTGVTKQTRLFGVVWSEWKFRDNASIHMVAREDDANSFAIIEDRNGKKKVERLSHRGATPEILDRAAAAGILVRRPCTITLDRPCLVRTLRIAGADRVERTQIAAIKEINLYPSKGGLNDSLELLLGDGSRVEYEVEPMPSAVIDEVCDLVSEFDLSVSVPDLQKGGRLTLTRNLSRLGLNPPGNVE